MKKNLKKKIGRIGKKTDEKEKEIYYDKRALAPKSHQRAKATQKRRKSGERAVLTFLNTQ